MRHGGTALADECTGRSRRRRRVSDDGRRRGRLGRRQLPDVRGRRRF